MVRSRVPSPEEHARLWQALDFKERRRLLKSVSRGQGLEARKDARIGVGIARMQQRYWRKAWLIGPAIGLVRLPDWVAVVATAAIGAILMGLLSMNRYRNAVKAERANLKRLGVS